MLEWLSATACGLHAALLQRESWMRSVIAGNAAAAAAMPPQPPRPQQPLVVPEELPREGEIVPLAMRARWSSRPGGGGDPFARRNGHGEHVDADAAAFLADALFEGY